MVKRKKIRNRTCVCSWQECKDFQRIFGQAEDRRAGWFTVEPAFTSQWNRFFEMLSRHLAPNDDDSGQFLAKLGGAPQFFIAKHHYTLQQLELIDPASRKRTRSTRALVSRQAAASTCYRFEEVDVDESVQKSGGEDSDCYFVSPNVPLTVVREEIRLLGQRMSATTQSEDSDKDKSSRRLVDVSQTKRDPGSSGVESTMSEELWLAKDALLALKASENKDFLNRTPVVVSRKQGRREPAANESVKASRKRQKRQVVVSSKEACDFLSAMQSFRESS